MKPITLLEAEYVAHRLAAELMNYDEPIADFSTRYPNKLESCLEQPFVTYDGVELYPALLDKAILHFYLIIKNHPFENGNKRMAVTVMLYFLYKNGKFIKAPADELYRIAVEVAKSDMPIDDQVQLLKLSLAPYIIDLKQI